MFESSEQERIRAVADDTPAYLWYADAETDETFLNRAFAKFLGIESGQMLNNVKLVIDVIHPEDARQCREGFVKAVEARAEYEGEYRVRRFDGEYRWVVGRGLPRFSSSGKFLGYAGSTTDITDLKRAMEELKTANVRLESELMERIRAERELHAMGERLIAAQEEERARIARDLHDDFSQRIAAIALSLVHIQRSTGHNATEVIDLAQKLQARVVQLASDMRQLSHLLHPTMLEFGGLLPALHAYCQDFTSNTGIEISFERPDSIPDMQTEVALCLFRIAQEALQNVARHAGVTRAEVRLEQVGDPGKPEGVRISVSDKGAGFDKTHTEYHRSLGLISMKERARAVNGTLEVESGPGCGTTVVVTVPVHVSANEKSY